MSEPSVGGRFNVWRGDTDPYNHVELFTNWDVLDALIGGTAQSGADPWPPSGQTIKSVVQSITTQTVPLGTVVPWWRPPATGGGSTFVVVPTGGWEICDGRTVATDFVDNAGNLVGSIILPDLRNRFILGAQYNPALDGTASTAGNTSANGPYMVKGNAPGSNIGEGGTNANLGVSLSVPNHYHEHRHAHQVGPVSNATSETTTENTGANFVPSSPNQTAVAQSGHNHSLQIYSSGARRPDDANMRIGSGVSPQPTGQSATARQMTSLQFKASNGADNTEPTGGAAGDALSMSQNIDGRPLHVGLLYIMKVRVSS